MIKLHSASPKDKEGILAVASATWEGWDYVPLFLDAWIAEGGLYVAEHSGQIVGITKTTELSEGELWLEAIRVAEESRGKGWGREIAQKQLKLAIEADPRSIRLSTADINTTSLKIIGHLGFEEYARFRYLQLPSKHLSSSMESAEGVQLLHREDSSKAWDLIRGSEEFRVSKGLLPQTWKFCEWTEDLFVRLMNEGSVYVTEDHNGVLVLLPNRYAPANPEVAFIEGDETALEKLEAFAKLKLASASGEGSIVGFSAGKRKRSRLERIGMRPHERINYVYVFDYPL
ncbi:GNAT family N-acetyltransferase [candidate division WOR-3 bacterium]|nr:GNAT family N-acetyltransferase [candidate division WOR-3 bacterium]